LTPIIAACIYWPVDFVCSEFFHMTEASMIMVRADAPSVDAGRAAG
jgi:hypothetical protein